MLIMERAQKSVPGGGGMICNIVEIETTCVFLCYVSTGGTSLKI